MQATAGSTAACRRRLGSNSFCERPATLLIRRQAKGNIISDEVRPALLRLAVWAETLTARSTPTSLVYAPNFIVAAAVPSTAPQPVLWAQYLFVFPDVTLDEDKERLAQFLYFKGITFSDIDRDHFDALDNERGYYLSSLIRRGRFNPRLSVDWTPITPDEVIPIDVAEGYALEVKELRQALLVLGRVTWEKRKDIGPQAGCGAVEGTAAAERDKSGCVNERGRVKRAVRVSAECPRRNRATALHR